MVLGACVLASSMVFIDGSALTVALPNLRADLGADLVSVQWVLNAYVLALASLTLIGGALADLHGKARMLSIGCLAFGAASAACALAPSVGWLICARGVQGMAAAVVAPASLALIGAIYPRAERNRAIGAWAAASALTTAGGPVLGGWLTEIYCWQLVFWINPPLALVALGLLAASSPRDHREARQFDVVGAVILAAALGALAWALSQIGQGVSSPGTVTVAAVLGIVGLGAYALWERSSPYPMTPPRLARNSPFVGLNVATVLLYGAASIMFFLLPFELVDRRGLPATDAGLVFLPFTLAVGLLSRLFGSLADAIGARAPLVWGSIGAALAYFWMALAGKASLGIGVLAPMTLLGVSFALIAAPITASVLSSVEQADEGIASGINNAVSRVAQLVGVALAAGLGSFVSGYGSALAVASVFSIVAALVIALTLPPAPVGARADG
jgi:EmrB/QacA subfamily drug resistance transporter